jgi:phosphoenolpyruvate carboxylase
MKASGELDPVKFQAEETSERAGFKSISMDISVRSDADEDTLRELFKRLRIAVRYATTSATERRLIS